MSTTKVPRIEGASCAPDAPWREHDNDSHGHVVQFYSEDRSLVETLGRFIGAALGAGDAAIVVATKAHRDGLAEQLESRGLNVASAIEEGRYISLDAAETMSEILVDGWPDESRFASHIGGVITRARSAAERVRQSRASLIVEPRVAVFGEMVALLWADGKHPSAIRLEQLWNDLAKTHSFSLRCAYPMAGFHRQEHSEPFLKICAEHSAVIPGESYTSLKNEADRLRNISQLQQKAQALDAEIAERKVAQESLHQREIALQDAVQHAAMGKLAAIIAHEINNPLEVIANVFFLLRDHPSLDENARSLAITAESEISRVRQIANQTLSFYRESGKPISVPLNHVLDSVLDIYDRSLKPQGISLERKYKAHREVRAFPVEIRQVFVNLIGNALQAMPEGGVLRIGIRDSSELVQDSRRMGVRVNITDTGVGIPAKYRDKLFQPFVTTKAEKGTGLGLWVSRGLVQKLGGTIRFRSGKIRGKTITSFSVFIPTSSEELDPVS
ncbi:MAG TPA: ATP-binding protein [Candidatus Acidoferrales bacterium]|nr:ATP-binding protein [Candidatus Acidoferrales bacterium]